MRCPSCGFDDPDNPAFCTECGTPIPLAQAPSRGMPPPGPDYGHSPYPAARMEPAQRGSEAQVARLDGLEGPVEGQHYLIESAQLTIGRRSDCDLVVSDPSVSRVHARLRTLPGGTVVIEDAQSANGTWVNGVRLNPGQTQPLAARDVIRIGKAAFSFRPEVQASATPPPAQTWIQEVGRDPSPFESHVVGYSEPGPSPAHTPRPTPIEDWPTPEPVDDWPRPRPVVPTPAPASVTPPPPSPGQEALQRDLTGLRDELGPFIERLTALSRSLDELGAPAGLPGTAGSSKMKQLLQDLESEGGLEQYHDLEGLLGELRSDPTDLKLLLRLSDQLPAIERLLRWYGKALRLLR